jgi:uncharacterized protein (TIGR04255 family)
MGDAVKQQQGTPMPKGKLPRFRKPPVVETVLGVQFQRFRELTNGHLGAFWRRVAEAGLGNKRWTIVKDAAPLPSAYEEFEEVGWHPEHLLQISNDPSARLQIRNDRGDAMIQVQNGRIHYNWIGTRDEEYPSYKVVRPIFDRLVSLWTEFLTENGLGDLRPNQWEVTYVNHIPQGSVWHSPTDWADVLPGLLGRCGESGGTRFESMSGAWQFEFPEKAGRLHVDLKHGLSSGKSPVRILRLTLTARGPVNEKTPWERGLDLGHGALVLAFRDLTSAAAHAAWELEQ